MRTPLLLLLILSSIVLSGCETHTDTREKKSYKTYSTLTGSISMQDDIISTIEGQKTSQLSFRTSGIITDVHVRPGDIVKKGQILARLGNRESLIQAGGLARIEDQIVRLGANTEDIRQSTRDMQVSTEKLYDERIAGLNLSIITLENSLEKAKQNLGNQQKGVTNTLETIMKDFDRISTAMLYEGDKILGITTNFESQAKGWEPYLGARIGNSQVEAENAWNHLYSERGTIRAILETGGSGTITIMQAKLQNAYTSLRGLHTTMTTMLQNSIVGGGLSTETLDGWSQTWKGLGGEVQVSESGWISWKNSTSSLTDSANGSGTVADKDITALELELKTLTQNKQTLIAEKNAKLKEIQTNIRTVISKEGEIQVQIAETAMNASLAAESSRYNIIVAPYDGVILEKYIEEGMLANGGTPIVKISSTDGKMIKTYIDNTLYTYKLGDTITLSSHEHTSTHTGTIRLLQEQKDPSSNKNYTEMNISGDLTIGEKVTLHLARKKSTLQNGILIPLSSIITRYGPPGVYIVEGGKVRFQLVEVLGSDMSHAEVLGLTEGMTIITDGKENLYDGETL